MTQADPGPQIYIADPDPILNKMLLQETGEGPYAKPALMVGAATVFLAILILSFLTMALLWFSAGGSGIGWLGWFIVWTILFGAGAYWIAKKTEGKRWADSTLTGPLVHPLIDQLIFPLRFLVGGYQRYRRRTAAGDEAALARCALFVRDLCDLAGSAPLVKLAKPGETPRDMDVILDHLTSRNWAGHSSDRQRVWLSGDAKNDLIRWGIASGPFA